MHSDIREKAFTHSWKLYEKFVKFGKLENTTMKTIKIKHATMLAAFLVCASVASCQDVSEENYVIQGKVTHEDGSPIEAARIFSLFLKRTAPGSFMGNPTRTEIVETNAAGEATLKFASLPTPDGAVAMGKKGYYGSTARAIWKPNGAKSWTAEVSAVLKPVKNPIPMHASLMTGQKAIVIPEMDKDYGYDLERAELIDSFEDGGKADFIIRISGDYKSGTDAKITASIRFPDASDGLVYFETPNREQGSSFLGNYQAPESGYVNTLEIPFNSSETSKNMSRKNEGNYYFRIRTVRDASGNVLRSNYGKIHGDLMLWTLHREQGGVAQITWIESYFNPTLNDRNVEFDTRQNLNPDGKVQRP